MKPIYFFTRIIGIVTLVTLFHSDLFAQLKVGSNPTSISATSNLEIEATNGNKTIVDKTGKVTIQDGTQGADRFLKSDANGVASWVDMNSAKAPIIGVMPSLTANASSASSPVNDVVAGTAGDGSTGSYIDLPPGKWIVFGQFIINTPTQMDASSAIWVRSTLSSNATQTTLAKDPDVLGSWYISGIITGPSIYGMTSGQIIIQNTSASTKRYWLIRASNSIWGVSSNTIIRSYGRGYWFEDQFFALPLN